jgi:2-polyprenyl-6-methoxyphenol hydroxylase-like FAD-dependent oxidoreductase
MGVVVVGAGPAGLFTAIALARRGRDVTVVDRDPGPSAHGPWRRRGVMQFHHAHSFRGQVVEALDAEIPQLTERLEALGATVVRQGGRPATLQCRREVFERELWRRAALEPRLRRLTGHVDEVVRHRGRIAGVRFDGGVLDADLVIDASGRASRFGRALRGRGEGADCGATYVGRQFRLRDGAPVGPTNSVIGLSLNLAGYGAVVFCHDDRTFTVTLIHAGSDGRWQRLRDGDVFDAAVRTIPAVGDWIDPDRATAIAPVLPGGRLRNSYRGQRDDAGRLPAPAVIAVGDAVCTTTPLAGRGVALALAQARELIATLERQSEPAVAAAEFDDWCTRRIKPWFLDHVHVDGERVRRWAGADVDLTRPLPSDLIVAAAEADSALAAAVGPYVTMDALPQSLAPVEPRAHEIFAGGWRPTPAPGPSVDQLISAVSTTPAVA